MIRIRRIAVGTAALAAVAGGTILMSSPAHAQVGWGGTLTPGSVSCIGQHANTQVHGDGTATADGAKFFIYREGVQVYSSGGRLQNWGKNITATSNPVFPGAGDYTVCAKNTGATNTLVNFYILSDGEF